MVLSPPMSSLQYLTPLIIVSSTYMHSCLSNSCILTLGSTNSFSPDYKVSPPNYRRSLDSERSRSNFRATLSFSTSTQLDDHGFNAHTTCQLVSFVPVCVILARRVVDICIPYTQTSSDVSLGLVWSVSKHQYSILIAKIRNTTNLTTKPPYTRSLLR
jgi:hypothetical protein